jgi:hypothetical protein
MNVIGDAAGDDRLAAVFVDDAADVGVEARAEVVVDARFAILGAEYDVIEEMGERYPGLEPAACLSLRLFAASPVQRPGL